MNAARVVRVGICADDFGMAPAVDAAVLELAWRARISATSCLVDGPSFAAGAGSLAMLRRCGLLDVGLHLNLTQSFGEQAPRWPLLALVGRAYCGRLGRELLRAEIRRQLDRFEAVLGFAPDHVDGHLHVQQLPVVRQVLLEELEQRPGPRPWVRTSRSCRHGLPQGLGLVERCKASLIGALGAARLHQLLAARGFGSNQRLLGHYNMRCDVEQFLHRLEGWLGNARDGDLLMVHPATPPRRDMLGLTGRSAEYRVMASSALPAVLAEHGIGLVRLSQLVGAAAGASA